MWHDTMGGTKRRTEDSTIRLRRMGAAVDEIVETFAVVEASNGPCNPRWRRRLAAASRRLWRLASRPDHRVV